MSYSKSHRTIPILRHIFTIIKPSFHNDAEGYFHLDYKPFHRYLSEWMYEISNKRCLVIILIFRYIYSK